VRKIRGRREASGDRFKLVSYRSTVTIGAPITFARGPFCDVFAANVELVSRL